MRIYHNIPALNAYNQLSLNQNSLANSIKKLSSGLRINGAADDAAGLAISEKMRAQIKGLDVATRNAQDGISMIQTAEGALSSTNDILQRMRELAVQAANDTLTQQDREYIQLEINQLRDEVNRISSSTQFNKKRLLDGSSSVLWSSDSLDTKLVIKGGLRQIDQFGQKLVNEGNYKVLISANPGQAELQKSDIFKIKHKNVISNLAMDTDRINAVRVDNLPAGNYTVNGQKGGVIMSVAGMAIAAGSWVAGSATVSATAMLGKGSIVSGGTIFSAGGGTNTMVFGAGAVFTADTNHFTTIGGAKLAAGTVITTAMHSTVAATVGISAGGTIAANSTIVSSTLVQAGMVIRIASSGVVHTVTAGGVTLDSITTFGAAGTFAATLVNNFTLAQDLTFVTGGSSALMSVTLASVSGVANANGGADFTTATGTHTTIRLGGDTRVLGGQLTIPTAPATYTYKLIDNARLAMLADMKVNNAVQLVTATVTFSAATQIWAIAPQSQNIYQTFGLLTNAGVNYGMILSQGAGSTFSGMANILLEVKNVDTTSKIVTFKAIAQVLFADGSSQAFVLDDLKVKENDGATWTAFGIAGNMFTLAQNAITAADYSVGDKMTFGFVSLGSASMGNSTVVKISGTQNTQWGGNWGTTLQDMSYIVNDTDVRGKDVHFRSFYLNSQNGSVYESNISVAFNSAYAATTAAGGAALATFNATYIGQTALSDTQLRDLDKFWDPNGKFMLDDPKTLTITQGDGKVATVTLYANDSMGDLVRKFNDAISKGLEQGRFVSNTMGFASFVTNSVANSPESVMGTMLLRTAINGVGGTLNFSGDQDIMNALSLNVIQQAKENEFFVSIQDAHSGQPLVNTVKVSGNYAVGLLHPNLDFEFDPNADMKVTWNDKTKKYETSSISSSGAKAYETIIHVADNTAVFQIGANQGEDMSIDVGDMSMRALGLHKVLLTNRESASRSITIIDTALNTLASQRAKLGAYQNRLEYTVNNLTTAAENLTAAESRIRDLDMAKEMMNFTKLNILMQSGQSMLSQANQMPQAILQLLRG